MKRYFLSYNLLTKDYYLDYGTFDKTRKELGKLNARSLLEKLRHVLPSHRKILLYVENSLEEKIRKELLQFFKGTQIKIEFKKEFNREHINTQL